MKYITKWLGVAFGVASGISLESPNKFDYYQGIIKLPEEKKLNKMFYSSADSDKSKKLDLAGNLNKIDISQLWTFSENSMMFDSNTEDANEGAIRRIISRSIRLHFPELIITGMGNVVEYLKELGLVRDESYALSYEDYEEERALMNFISSWGSSSLHFIGHEEFRWWTLGVIRDTLSCMKSPSLKLKAHKPPIKDVNVQLFLVDIIESALRPEKPFITSLQLEELLSNNFLEIIQMNVIDEGTKRKRNIKTVNWSESGREAFGYLIEAKNHCFKKALLVSIYSIYCHIEENPDILSFRSRIPLTFGLGDSCLWVKKERHPHHKVLGTDGRHKIEKGRNTALIGIPSTINRMSTLSTEQNKDWMNGWMDKTRRQAMGRKKTADDEALNIQLKGTATQERRKAKIADTAGICYELQDALSNEDLISEELYGIFRGDIKIIIDAFGSE